MSYRIIGKSINRIDSLDKVTGRALYPGDRAYGDEVWLKVLFSKHPHAQVVSIDASKAETLPGVLCVLTAKDVPVNQCGLEVPDQPVLCGPGSSVKGGDIVRFIGDKIAVAIAEKEDIAAQARDLIKVEYRELPVVDDPKFSLSGEAPQLHSNAHNNIAAHYRIRKGDTDAAWSDCDVIVEGVYRTPFQEHVFLQPEAGTAYIDDLQRITVHCAGQCIWDDHRQISYALELPSDRIRVVYDAIGGAFGGREDITIQIILALAVYQLDRRLGIRRPVKLIWNREESTIGHGKRHAVNVRAKWGARRDGSLVAAEIEILSDAGAYLSTSSKVLERIVISSTGPYEFPNVKIDAFAVYTNNLSSGAMRGFGAPQGHFAAEMQMNKLAFELRKDPVELRLRNILDNKKLLSVGTPIPGGVSLECVIRETAKTSNWDDHWPQTRRVTEGLAGFVKGRGFAVGFKNAGFGFGYQENSWARVELKGGNEVKEAILRIAGADVGQGHHTVMAQITAETLSLDLEKIRIEGSDTAFAQSSGAASSSRLTLVAGNAVNRAAEAALLKWKAGDRPAVGEAIWLGPETTPLDPQTGQGVPNFAYGYVAQMAEVTVDTETGAVNVERIVCADDVGRAVNPKQVIGQIEGAIVQAHGYTLLENFCLEKARVLTSNLGTYLIPGVYDIPDQIDSIIVEEPHPEGPYGVRGMGEMPFLPYAPAVASALFDATGIWFDELPITPERILRRIDKIKG